MTIHFLSIQGSYSSVQIALFKDNQIIESICQTDVKASSHLIPYIDDLLKKHNFSLNNLAFIAIDKGPGAFTSLRVSIATVNGIAFAHQIPLVGIDGLDCLAQDGVKNVSDQNTIIVCLLNAYNNDVYFGLYDMHGKLIAKGCKNIVALIEQLRTEFQINSFLLTGNGVELHQNILEEQLPTAIIQKPLALVCSAKTVGLCALESWTQRKDSQPVYAIEPNYIKTQLFTPQKK